MITGILWVLGLFAWFGMGATILAVGKLCGDKHRPVLLNLFFAAIWPCVLVVTGVAFLCGVALDIGDS